MKQKKGTFPRLLGYLFKYYKVQLIVVIICIIVSSLSSVVSTVFLQRLIDDCITPGIELGLDSVWTQLISILITMAVIFVLGVICSFLYTRIMGIVTQGTLHRFRSDMFNNMETLPVKYFDTHAHGDIMSTYTNDTDAVRQLIGQSIPTLIQSVLSVVAMFMMMLYYSIWLTIAVCLFMVGMIMITRKIGGASAKYMMRQQKSLAREEGFIEEIMEGQKVVQVFCHEEESKAAFVQLNEQLFKDGEQANIHGNILMPILNNMGNIMYVILAVIGGLLAYLKAPNFGIAGTSILSVGIVVSFLNMARQLSQIIGQASMQVSMIAMGVAGAGRVFELIDQASEQDEGYVTLVRAERTPDGGLKETQKNTKLWAWKHPHQDGSLTYTELKGDIVLDDVDFGYNPDKMVLHNITLFAKPGQKIAFVGSTGAGKTTITNLINRFYDIADGKIRYDGINMMLGSKQSLN